MEKETEVAEMNRRKPDERSARELLSYVSADCSRDEWVRIAMALHAGLGDAGRARVRRMVGDGAQALLQG